jgi:hypothetical protein
MRRLHVCGVALAMTVGALAATPTRAGEVGCSPKMLVGSWVFATDVGQYPAYGGDITALGTLNVDPRGRVSGTFDVTVADQLFVPDVGYVGTIEIGADCRGTAEIVTDLGSTRRDSFVLVSPTELWGMSQFPENLWTYRARKVASRRVRR